MESRNRRARLVGVVAVTATAVLAGLAAAAGVGSGPAAHPASAGYRAVGPDASLAVVRSAPTGVTSGEPMISGQFAGASPDPTPQGRARSAASSSAPGSRTPTIAASGRRIPVRRTAPERADLPAAALVAGAGPVPAGWVTTAHTVSVGGLSRVYLTVEPAQPAPGLPIVLLMHGRRMTPDGVLRISRLADRIGPAVLVVPAGWDRSWNVGDCCGAAYLAGVNDVAFIRTVISDVIRATPGGRLSKVYAVGFSNGGRLAYLLACDMPGVLSGFVAVEAVPVETCSPPRPLDMTIVAQQSDPLLTVGAGRPKTIYGFTEPTVAATLARLESVDHCSGPPVVVAAGVSVERAWTCAEGSRLSYVWYPGGAHNWRAPTVGTPGATDFVLQMLGRGPAGGSTLPKPAGPLTG